VAAPAWLIEIVAGHTWRFSTRRITYDGELYADGLETPGAFEDLLAMDVPAERSMPVVVDAQQVPEFDPEDIGLGATARLLWWRDPDDGDPVVVLSGDVIDPEWGAPGNLGLLVATVREVPWEDRGLLPDADAKINATTWPNFDADAPIEEEFYPLVIGSPGIWDGNVLGSPGYYVQVASTDYILVAGHPVLSSEVTIYDRTGDRHDRLAVSTVADGLGRKVAVVDGTAWTFLNQGDELWCIWTGNSMTDPGGLRHPDDPTQALRGAGDVVEYLLRRSTIRVDWGRQRAARHRLNAYKIDAYIGAGPSGRVSPWEWIVAHLLPILPVVVRTSPEGLYLAVWDPSQPAEQARASLEAGRNCERLGPVSVIGTDDVLNDWTLEYAPRAESDKGSATLRLTGDPKTLRSFPDAIQHPACAESVRRYGRRSEQLSTAVIYDAPTAGRILLQRAAVQALPPAEVAYLLLEHVPQLEVGDAVTVTDSDLGWTDRVLHVWSLRPGDDGTEVVLRQHRIPGRDY